MTASLSALNKPLAPTTTLSGEAALRRRYLDLFLISFVILFFELACIRWFGSMVIFLTFFTNLVLMATFLGMTVGCLAASNRRSLIHAVIPLSLIAVLLAGGALWGYQYFGRILIDVGGQGSPQQIYFGTEYRAKDPSAFVIPIEAVAGVFYVLIALIFVGLGQVMGRTLNEIPNRVAAYTTNIAGSLAGIVAFALASYFRTSPYLWFAISLAICLYFVRRWTPLQIFGQMAVLFLIGVTSYGGRGETYWSPYYKVRYSPLARSIATNNIGHQTMARVGDEGPGYVLPHLLNRDAGGRAFEQVLVIGAGSGNDVQAALAHGAKHIDAVEIDPVIYDIGRADHPNHPYDDPRVTIHLDDGRSFVRKTSQQYDLVVYALVDSLVLHSGYSSLRLESFLFTEQAFEDIKARLKPGGVFAVYNAFRQGWVVGRLQKMAEKVFDSKAIVVSLPYVEQIAPNDNQAGRITFILVGGRNAPAIGAIRNKLQAQHYFWVNNRPDANEPLNGFGPQPPVAGDWNKIGLATVDVRSIDLVPTDDWPFLYLRDRTIPVLNIRGMALIAMLSLVILFLFAPVRRIRPNWQMFFLGAGFMLLETKGVVHMALLFGSTWMVNSIVFFAILIMILCSNLFVLAAKPKKLWPYYALLMAALLLNTFVPMSRFLALPGWEKVAVSCAVIFIPIFFAGIIFGAAFRDSRQPDIDFGSNIGGVVLGGLSEYFSLVVGFNYLLAIAIAFYLLSAVLKPRISLAPA